MNPAFTILTNPHIINNIFYKHKGLQSPTAKIMNDFFKEYDTEVLNERYYYNAYDEQIREEVSKTDEKLIIDIIKECFYDDEPSYYTEYFLECNMKRHIYELETGNFRN